jgi:hypothetical protein
MRALRDHGGVTDDEKIEIPPGVEVQVLVAPDPSDESMQALAAAQLAARRGWGGSAAAGSSAPEGKQG